MSSSSFHWHIAPLFRDRDTGDLGPDGRAYAIVVLNTPLRNDVAFRTLWANASLRVAADGGANRLHDLLSEIAKSSNMTGSAEHLFIDLDVIIGDLDSLRPVVGEFFGNSERRTQVICDPDQESTDFGKAINYIRTHYSPTVDIVAVGSLGGRVDQGISQLHQLYVYQPGLAYEAGRVYLVTNHSLTFLLKPGKHWVHVRDGGEDAFDKYVGIIPTGEPSVISTQGLEWDVTDWPTRFGARISTSNHVRPEVEVVEVETTNEVLFTIALRRTET